VIGNDIAIAVVVAPPGSGELTLSERVVLAMAVIFGGATECRVTNGIRHEVT
jgi:hypothetical protein